MQGYGEGKPNKKKPLTFLQPARHQGDKAVAAGVDQVISFQPSPECVEGSTGSSSGAAQPWGAAVEMLHLWAHPAR